MPNHVTNIVKITGPAEVITNLKTTLLRPGNLLGKDSDEMPELLFDFNGILPMPESLNINSGSASQWAFEWLSLQDNWLLSGKEVQKYLLFSYLQKLMADSDINWQTDSVSRLKKLAQENGIFESLGLSREYIEKISHNLREYGCPTWYEWCNSHWGTKWNAYGQYLTEWSDTGFAYVFNTAWSTPYLVYTAIAEAFPDIEMEVHYIEEGCHFAGTYRVSDGILENFPCEDDDFSRFAQEYFGWDPMELEELDGDDED